MKITQSLMGKHYTSPRRDKVRFIVAHHMTIVGNGKGSANDACYRVWQSREASAHYGVDGANVRRFVRDSDAAWATGNATGNHAGISIEHANSTAGPHWRISETTWKTGARLAAKLHVDHSLGRPVAGVTLRKHSNFSSTACPGPFMDSTWGEYVREAQREYDRLTRKAKKRLRLGSWNLALITKRPRLGDRLRRIRRQVKKRNLDVLFTQERPQRPGKRLDGTLGHLTVKVGNKARYIYFREGTKIHGSATWDPWKKSPITKWVTSACATVPGDRKRFYVNCHAVSGSQHSKHRDRWAKAVTVKAERRAKKHGLGPEDIIYAGDFNGPEFARRASNRGYVRGRRWAKNQDRTVRTFNAWGKRDRTHAGGQFSYFVVHESMRTLIHRARTFWNWLASDHNLTILEIRE